MTRRLNEANLTTFAKHLASEFVKPTRPSATIPRHYVGGRQYVLQDLRNLTFKDEFHFILPQVRELLRSVNGAEVLKDFDNYSRGFFTPREDHVLEVLLLKKLAVDMSGVHVKGALGTTQRGNRVVGKRKHMIKLRKPQTQFQRWTGQKGEVFDEYALIKNIYWPIYAGETEERLSGSSVVDELPEGTEGLPIGATNPGISNLAAIDALDAIVDRLDLGSTDGEIRGRDGAQPADVDAAETGTLLFTLPMSAVAFGAAVDDTQKATATAATITDDSSADAGGTLSYCRCASTGAGADDELDGEAGTSASDFNFNTLAITAGATVSMTAFTVSLPET